jgi:hypothetical protein
MTSRASLATVSVLRRAGGFLKRQVDDHPTAHQVVFDLSVGVLLPVLCLLFDPLQMFGASRTQVWGFLALQMAALATWVTLLRRSSSLAAVFAGVLLTGASFSALLCVLMVPLALWMTVATIGWLYESVFGLMPTPGTDAFLWMFLAWTPLWTMLVYGRNTFRARRRAGTSASARIVRRVAFGGTVSIILASLFATQFMTRTALADVRSGDPARVERGTARLVRWEWYMNSSTSLLGAYHGCRDADERLSYSNAFRAIRGYPIGGSTYR